VKHGSLSELDTHIEVARRLGYLTETKDVEQHMSRVFQLLTGLVSSLRAKQ